MDRPTKIVPPGYRWHQSVGTDKVNLGPVDVTGMSYDDAVNAAWEYFCRTRPDGAAFRTEAERLYAEGILRP